MTHASAPSYSAAAPAATDSTVVASIQALRGLAAVATVISHAWIIAPDTPAGAALAVLTPWVLPLRASVDVFFIISGLVMMAQIQRPTPPDWATFLIRRLIRIYPPYWLASLTLVPGFLAGVGLFLRADGPQPTLVASFALLPQAAQPLLMQGWSLVHEMVFYLVITAILAARQRAVAVWVVALLASIAVAQSALGVTWAHGHLFSVHMVEFLAGMTFWHMRRRVTPALAMAAIAIGVLFLAGVGVTAAGTPYPSEPPIRVVLYGIPAALFVLGALGLERMAVPGWLARPCRLLGDTSYSIYLFHLVPLAGATWLAQALSLGSTALAALVPAAVAAAVGYGVVLGRLVELPLHRWLLVKVAPRRRPAGVPALASTPAE